MRYADLVALYQQLESTSRRLAKTQMLATALQSLAYGDVVPVMYLLQGTVFPPWSSQEVGVAERLVIKAMQLSFGETEGGIEGQWRTSGDLGRVAQALAGKKKQATLWSQELSVQKVFENIKKLSTLEGPGTVDRKVQLMAELLTSANPVEARFIVRTLVGQLRAGLGEGTLRDALVWAYVFPVKFNEEKGAIQFYGEDQEQEREAYNGCVEKLQYAIDLTCDCAEVAVLLRDKGVAGLSGIGLHPGRPVKVMLFQKASGIADAMARVGSPCFVEYKYDGFRMQIHKSEGVIRLFTRRLEDVTSQFPDVAAVVAHEIRADSFIIDAEVIGYDPQSKAYLPFQSISQRIKRKYAIQEMSDRFPVEVRVFDMLLHDGVSLLNEPYSTRRARLESMVPTIPWRIAPAVVLVADVQDKAQAFYGAALEAGMEGVMVKNPRSPYQPGSRVGFGVKVKPVMDTLDLVVVRAEWGEGKRAGWLTSFTLACRDADGSFREVGNVGTGFKEKPKEGVSFLEITELLRPHIRQEQGRIVEIVPAVVLEVKFEEIQHSPTYSSGYALRFPRLVQVRDDKPPQEASTVKDVEDLFREQRA